MKISSVWKTALSVCQGLGEVYNVVKIELGEHKATACINFNKWGHTVGHLTGGVHTILGQKKIALIGNDHFCEPHQLVIWLVMSCVVE